MSLKTDLEASHGSLDRALQLLAVEITDLHGKGVDKARNAVINAAASTRTAIDIIASTITDIETEKEIAEIKTEDMKADEERFAMQEAEERAGEDNE